jgi:hypothetical protein
LIYHLNSTVVEAQQNPNCEIVSIDWLLSSVKAKAPLAVRGFLIRALGSKRLVSTTSDSGSKPTHKRKLSSDLSQSASRRTKGGKDRVLANIDKLSALVDKGIPAEGSKYHVLARSVGQICQYLMHV